jgi:hypothetical protein
MRLTLFAALGILLGQAPAPGDPEPGRVVDKVGGFSWVPPKGWKVYDPAAKKSAVPRSNQAWGSAAKGPAPSIVFEDFVRTATVNGKPVKTTLEDCVAFFKEPPIWASKEAAETFMVVAEKKLKTEAGLECAVVVTYIHTRRITYYCFDLGGERFLVARCTASYALPDQGEKLDPVFEASVKSFRLEKQGKVEKR